MRQLSDDEQQTIEHRILTDADLFEELEITEDELLDEYMAGGLSENDRQHFKSKFLANPERIKKHRFAEALGRYRSDQKKEVAKHWKLQHLISGLRQSFQRARTTALPLAQAAVILIVVGVGFAVWRGFFHQSDVDRGLIALNAAYREQRPVEARITQLDYAPFVTTRGTGAAKFDESELRRAELTLLDAQSKNPTPAVHHALGKVYLAKNDFNHAIKQFEEALESDSNNAQVYADLGAALLEKGKITLAKAKSEKTDSEAGMGLEDLARSLENLNKALALKPDLLEALFNRALCYQYMMLPHQAAADWREYLRGDPSSQWAEEARRNLKLLEEQQRTRTSQNKNQLPKIFLDAYQNKADDRAWQIISQSHSSAGNGITNALVTSYLDLKRDRRDEEARNKLELLSYAGQLTERRGDDRYMSDLARFYSLATVRDRAALTRAREGMERGYQLFTESHFTDAIVAYSEAKRLFEQVGDLAEAIFADYRIGHCYMLQPNLDKSNQIFERLLSASQSKNYRWLLAQSLFGGAYVRIGLSEYSKAIEYSNQALELAEQLRDTDGVVKSLIQLAEEYRALNNKNKSLSLVQQSLVHIGDDFLEPMQAWGPYIAISLNLNSFSLHAAALEYQQEALRLALDMARPLIISRSYVYLGLTYGHLKRYEEAIRNIQQAIETGRSLTRDPNGLEMVANASVQLGEIYRQMGDHGGAIAAYDQSLRLYDQLSFQYFAFAAHKGKLLSFMAQHNDASAAQEIQIVLDMFQQFRSRITGQSQRNTFFDAEQSIYDLAIDFEYSRRNNPQQAFEYSESSRARSLRDNMRRRGEIAGQESSTELNHLATSMAPTFLEIQRGLPPKSQIVEYSLLNDKLLIWVVTSKELLHVTVPIGEALLTQKVQSYLSSLQRTSGTDIEASQGGRELYNILIKPVENLLDKNNLLCLVPDKILNYLPYEALISPTSGRYVIEDYLLELTPSAGIFLDCSKIAHDKGGAREEKLLSIGNPDFDRKLMPALSNLPAAAREAESIARNYPSHRLLVGSNATPRQIKTEIVHSDVTHFAAHYVVDPRSEMLSELILAKEPVRGNKNETSQSVLRAYEIYQLKLPQTRLVVLSGCQTGVEQQYRGEGAVGLAYPFLSARVPLVVASLWAVDSESTADLMIDFHEGRRLHGLPTAAALRQAQLHMLHGPNERYHQPYYWASFVTIGGHADF
ncbi:MAG TPA: CHAT domain-containing protein [Pyrinomonadaceae bacterium]|nr:CHAT domain-containing protein [Pyrinomonadaceae bacterium]